MKVMIRPGKKFIYLIEMIAPSGMVEENVGCI